MSGGRSVKSEKSVVSPGGAGGKPPIAPIAPNLTTPGRTTDLSDSTETAQGRSSVGSVNSVDDRDKWGGGPPLPLHKQVVEWFGTLGEGFVFVLPVLVFAIFYPWWPSFAIVAAIASGAVVLAGYVWFAWRGKPDD